MKKIALSIIVVFVAALSSSAQVFIDTNETYKPISIGLRVGGNTSNLSTNYESVIPDMGWNHTQWRGGFTLGTVLDVRLRNFIALQTGLFVETRSCRYHYLQASLVDDYMSAYDGEYESNYWQVPLMLSFRVNWGYSTVFVFDIGPYFAWGFGGDNAYSIYTTRGDDATDYDITQMKVDGDFFGKGGVAKSYDWGFKMGVGIELSEHYYIGAHYLAGCRNVMKQYPGFEGWASGRNKAWSFTVGYNF